ncbi:MAG: hypothetical protein JWQ30_30 [Sediminibacterium sp.]|nr:hypothetical protein [Sediminibacterium sp.]
MKKIFLLIGLMIGLMSFSPQNDPSAIANALKTADGDRVSAFFDDYVDIKLLEKPEVKNMGRNQAAITLKTFFSENGIKGFETTSQREMSGTMYLTGKLVNSTKGYNITIMMKSKDGKWQIITLRIS